MKTVIFDFDGTIADSFDAVLDVAYSLIKHSVFNDPTEIARLRNHSLLDMSQELKIPKYKWPYLLIRGRKLLGKKIDEVEPFAGIKDVVSTLDNSGYQLLVMSNNSAENISRFLKKYGMSDKFQDIYGGVGLFGKTSALRKIIKKNKLSSNEVIYIGDEPRDIDAAKNNNMACISVGWGFNDPKLLKKSDPFIIANKPSEIIDAVKKWDS